MSAPFARWMAIAGVLVATAVAAQQTNPAERRVTGRVVRGTRKGPTPVPGAWAVLHRVGPDRAGALDSIRTSATGSFTFRYRPSGDSTAIYFVAASYGGIHYFTPPLRASVVSGDEAMIAVFDTTSRPIPIAIAGRHIIVGAPQANGSRPMGEVFELQNDTTLTLVSNDSVPLWTTRLPPGATNFALNASGDISPKAVTQRGGVVGLFAPLSPGMRQFAFTYDLPASSFPLSLPLDRATGVLELLVQEPSARVDDAPLEEVAPVAVEGRTFRRLQGQNVPADAIIRIDIPQVVAGSRMTVYAVVAATMLAAMLGALFVAARRRPRRATAAGAAERPADALAREIARLDADFERAPNVSDEMRVAYTERRAALKQRLADALADGRQLP